MSENVNNYTLDDVEARLTIHEGDSDIHVTAAEKENWNSKANYEIVKELTLKNQQTVLLRNLVPNGSFEDEPTGWNKTYNCDFVLDDNDSKYGAKCLKLFAADNSKPEGFAQYWVNNYRKNHKYYIRVMTKCELGAYSQLYFGNMEGCIFASSNQNNWALLSLYAAFVGDQESTYIRLDCNNWGQDRACYFDGICMVDLTAAFGKGMEPNKEWCDKYIPFFKESMAITYPSVTRNKLENLVQNSSYEDGMEHWLQMVGNMEITNAQSRNGCYSAHVRSVGGNNAYYQIVPLIAGHQYYAVGHFYPNSIVVQSGSYIRGVIADILTWAEMHFGELDLSNFELEKWMKTSVVFTPENTKSYGFYPEVNGKFDVNIDGLMLLDLTNQFGAGNEPSQEWCDKNIPFFEKELNYFYPNLTGSVVKNLVQNGSFEDGFNGWELNGETVYSISADDAADGVFSVLKEQAMEETTYLKQTLEWKAGHKYYYTAQAETFDEIVYFSINVDDGSSMFSIRKTGEQFVKGSKIYSCRTDQSQWLMVGYNTNYYAMYFDSVMVIDLTESFGAGNEPTKEWCDLHIPYFEGTLLL